MKPNSKKLWNMLHQSSIAGMADSEKLMIFADAYLDSAISLCRRLVRRWEEATYPEGVVVVFLAAHAYELFLKGAISTAEKPKQNHHVDQLFGRYRKLFPGNDFRIERLFQPEQDDGEAKSRAPKLPDPSVLYRYPEDSPGVPWKVISAVEPRSMLKTLQRLKRDFVRLRGLLLSDNPHRDG